MNWWFLAATTDPRDVSQRPKKSWSQFIGDQMQSFNNKLYIIII
jgi:hypothetical protein